MLAFRPLDLAADRDFVLDLHCLANYAGDQPWFRGGSYEAYRQTWLATPQPQSFLAGLQAGIDAGSAITEVCEEDGRAVGYFCLEFAGIEGYGLKVAEVNDIAVLPADQRRGIGAIMLHHAEDLARQQGADLIRADIGVTNAASRALHERTGFEPYRLLYEKRLS
jgi:GNAT superfamily N-acetyltransferase